ncbi:MAG: PhnD/SsuA/transferrin family substrate-binding protein [Dissulfurimicrobium sp.]|uniref:PhnD/SsuA/transferrin family substrate-binding protein n=1 Tax=Dissulfurimicrobium sp. TaxID=2022436 RepID=UPI00404AFAA7
MAVAAIISPEGTVESYRPLLKYLGDVIGRPTKLIQRRTYWEVNEMIAKGKVDIAFICTGAYVQKGSDRKMCLSWLCRGYMARQLTGLSFFIVPALSKVRTFEDLKGVFLPLQTRFPIQATFIQ